MSSNPIALRVGAGHLDREQTFAFPDDWTLTVYPPPDADALDDEAVRDAFRHPVGCAPIAEAARGAKRVVILVDDFRRPTPAERLCRAILEQLAEAGIAPQQVTIIMGNGAHRIMDEPETRERLGSIVDEVGCVVSHDTYSADVVFVGLTSAGTPVLVNRLAAEADFLICVSTVYPHPFTSWGGGSKMVLPGVSHVSTIHYHHGRLSRTQRAADPAGNPARCDLEEAADFAGLNVAVCAVVNSRKELCALAVGQPRAAHADAVAKFRRVHGTNVDGVDIDLAVSNLYPLDGDPTQLSKAQWPTEHFGVPTVILADFADPSPYHGLYDGPREEYLSRERREIIPRTEEELMKARVFLYAPQHGTSFFPQNRSWYCEGDWDQLIEKLKRRLERPRVAVFPVGSLQIPAEASTDA